MQAPGSPFGAAKPGNGRLVLVRVGVAEGFKEGTLLGTRNDPLSTLGRVQGQKAAELLMDIQVGLPSTMGKYYGGKPTRAFYLPGALLQC